ncbi:formate dehydrogenase accessory sulfurtransferase FdhD [Chloroflexota bacterium]
MNKATFPVEQIVYKVGQRVIIDSEVIVEAPVSLTVNGELWLTLLCTPINLEALAVGFLYNESLIQSFDEIGSVQVCSSGDNIDVWINHSVKKPEKWLRTSGCTGGITFVGTENSSTSPSVLDFSETHITPLQVNIFLDELLQAQSLYHEVGGVHTSAVSDGNSILAYAEDIGRHNTLDKIAGHCLMEGIILSRPIIVTTGRISSEMLQKSSRLGASFVISRSAASSLSIQMAQAWGITLIGYARRNQFRVYTHPERIVTVKNEF